MKPRIWFNKYWFSSLASIVLEIKNYIPNSFILGSSYTENCAYKPVVDEFFVEKNIKTASEYINFALETCKTYKINIFFPKYFVNTIIRNKDKFEEIGVTVISEGYNTRRLFNSKATVYQYLLKRGYSAHFIPEYYKVTSLEEYKEAYSRIRDAGNIVCLKFDKDEGAQSFRVVTHDLISVDSLNETLENLVTPDTMLNILGLMEHQGAFKPLMVMPKLSSPEISVDCYNSPTKGFIAIPRYKYGERIKKVILNGEVIDNCREIDRIYKFKYGFNVQYRWGDNEELKLLEINPRLSGGIHMSTLAGFSIVSQVIADIVGLKLKQKVTDIGECTVTQYEVPVKV